MKIRNLITGEVTVVRDDPPEGWVIPAGWVEDQSAQIQQHPDPIPKEVTLRQFLMAADRSGMLATLEALKVSDGIPQQTRRDIHFFLEYSNVIERDHPLIAALAPVIGVTTEQIDAVFRLAATL